jgi:hypothetical protein
MIRFLFVGGGFARRENRAWGFLIRSHAVANGNPEF